MAYAMSLGIKHHTVQSDNGAHQSKVSFKAADKDKTGICNILVYEHREESKSFQRRAVAKPLDEMNTVRGQMTKCKCNGIHFYSPATSKNFTPSSQSKT